jgi:hypothetical protein
MTDECLHVSWEQESAATDGMCPICLAARVTYYRDMWKAQKAETERYADLYMDRCEKWSALREENERLREALHAGADQLDALRS